MSKRTGSGKEERKGGGSKKPRRSLYSILVVNVLLSRLLRRLGSVGDPGGQGKVVVGCLRC